jgi:hypothetical protein
MPTIGRAAGAHRQGRGDDETSKRLTHRHQQYLAASRRSHCTPECGWTADFRGNGVVPVVVCPAKPRWHPTVSTACLALAGANPVARVDRHCLARHPSCPRLHARSDRFKVRTSMIQTVIEQRLQSQYHRVARGRGPLRRRGRCAAGEWERYLRAVHPETSTPGLQGIGFSAHIQRSRSFGIRTADAGSTLPFAIWPSQDRDEFQRSSTFTRRHTRDMRALGYDMFTSQCGARR